MNEKERTSLIRKGNLAFNEGKLEVASKIFKATGYQPGLIRLGDYYFNEKHQPLIAFGYYSQAKHEPMLQRIKNGFSFALQCWLTDSDQSSIENKKKLTPEDLPSAGVNLLELIKKKS